MSNHIYVILYDISDDRKRQKASDLLERYGYERLQLSVFTGLQPPNDNSRLWKKLEKLLDEKNYPNDKFCCFAVSKVNFQQMKTLGAVRIDIDYLLGKRHVLFID